MAAHAVLSASGAHRWLECTPSARLEENFEDKPSISAREGTLAHAIAEAKIKNMFIEPLPKRSFNKILKGFTEQELYQKEMNTLTDEYTEYIREIMLLYPQKPYIAAEVKLNLDRYIPGGFGTADCVIIAVNDLHIVDLKYGKSTAVKAKDNPQLKLYALGVVSEYELFYDIQNVHMHIFQPRNADGGGIYGLSVQDLKACVELENERIL